MVTIKDATFLTSASTIEQCGSEDVGEVVFLGRSNVGKSSIINALTNRKGLAKSSSTPGKTRLINFFNITFSKNDELFLARFVDLPGFGYARVSKGMKEEWQKSLNRFIQQRTSIRLFVHLVDSRHPFLEIDKDVDTYVKEILRADQQMIKIFTKSDKLTQKEIGVILKNFPNSLLVSSSSKKGISKAVEEIFNRLFGVVL
ncbi:MAG: ribosome biogenesis GTP-binding protein YihA/YsxC [Sulfurospirillaceae bacterium]|nr:ribosome biogenesis GTP-binding protein YihA/YsxC [Sulfurospirillaceae bacterium]